MQRMYAGADGVPRPLIVFTVADWRALRDQATREEAKLRALGDQAAHEGVTERLLRLVGDAGGNGIPRAQLGRSMADRERIDGLIGAGQITASREMRPDRLGRIREQIVLRLPAKD